MSRVEIELNQGWAKGLILSFESAESSRDYRDEDFLHVKQVHGREVFEVEPSHLTDLRSEGLSNADGLLARGDWFRESSKPLMIKTADCAPLLYIDHQSKAVAAIHAGWKGLVQGIHRRPFAEGWMNPKTTWIWLGPCLSGKSFEVREDMWTQFGQAAEDPRFFEKSPRPEQRFFHAWAFIEEEFRLLGAELVYNLDLNTLNEKSFASYRRARQNGGTDTGARNLSWIGFQRPRPNGSPI